MQQLHHSSPTTHARTQVGRGQARRLVESAVRRAWMTMTHTVTLSHTCAGIADKRGQCVSDAELDFTGTPQLITPTRRSAGVPHDILRPRPATFGIERWHWQFSARVCVGTTREEVEREPRRSRSKHLSTAYARKTPPSSNTTLGTQSHIACGGASGSGIVLASRLCSDIVNRKRRQRQPLAK